MRGMEIVLISKTLLDLIFGKQTKKFIFSSR